MNHRPTSISMFKTTLALIIFSNSLFIARAAPNGYIRGSASQAFQNHEQTWKLLQPNLIYSDGNLELSLEYTTSDYIQDSFVNYALYSGERCTQGDSILSRADDHIQADQDTVSYLSSRIIPDGTPVGDGSQERKMMLTLNLDPTAICASDLHQDEETSDGQLDQDTAQVTFCVRFGLYNQDSTDEDAMEINFVETRVTWNVDLFADDATRMDNVVAEPIQIQRLQDPESTPTYEVHAFSCDDQFQEIKDSESVHRYGSLLRICVAPSQQALDAGVSLRRINFFDFTKDDLLQPAIEPDGQEASSGWTILHSCGGRMCAFETLLEKEFFLESGLVSGSGEAVLQYTNSKNTPEQLVKIVSRALGEEDGLAGDAEINLDVLVEASS